MVVPVFLTKMVLKYAGERCTVRGNSSDITASVTIEPGAITAVEIGGNDTAHIMDEVIDKIPAQIIAVAEGPFYCVKHELISLDVTGGVHANENFEVTKADGSVIPNLFAVGSTTVADIVGGAGGANFACAAYTSLTAAETIIGLLGN